MRADIGKRLNIYSSRYDEWSKATVVGIDPERRMHCVLYEEENKRKWHRMDMLKFTLEEEEAEREEGGEEEQEEEEHAGYQEEGDGVAVV